MLDIWHGAALTGLGRLDEAEAAFRAALPRFRHSVGSAYWAPFVAFWLARRNCCSAAMRVLGYIGRFAGAQTLAPAPAFLLAFNEADAVCAARSGDVERLRWRLEGLQMTEDEILELALPSVQKISAAAPRHEARPGGPSQSS